MKYFTISKTGDREINEDAVCMFEAGDKKIFVLADGLGGHGHGEVASQEAIETVKSCFLNGYDGDEKEEAIKTAFREANRRLNDMQREAGNSSFFKTTMVILMIDEKEYLWGYIGDSRLYRFEDKKLIERTMDHSVPQMLVNAGKIRERQIRHHEDRSKLLKVLGADEENSNPFIISREPLGACTSFLLCSDGFWEHIDERKMQKCLAKADSPENWIDSMEKIVLKNGKNYNMDNYSAIAVFA